MGEYFTKQGGIAYGEIAFVALMIFVYVIYGVFAVMPRDQNRKYYAAFLVCSSVTCVADIFYAFCASGIIAAPDSFCYFVNSVYFISVVLGAAFWLCFSATKISGKAIGKIRLCLLLIPYLLTSAYVAGDFIHKDIFTVSKGAYFRQSRYYIVILVPIITLFIISLVGLLLVLRTKKREKKKLCINIASISLSMIVFMLLQVLSDSLVPVFEVGIALLVLVSHEMDMQYYVSVDVMTRFFNRSAFEKSMDFEMLNRRSAFYLIMIDIDGLKRINDNFGHTEVDAAVSGIAEVISAKLPDNYKPYRFGNDEFAIIGKRTDEETVRGVCTTLINSVDALNDKGKYPFVLGISAGYAKRNPEMRKPAEIINLADKELYREKEKKREV